jgi:hypothetical protein
MHRRSLIFVFAAFALAPEPHALAQGRRRPMTRAGRAPAVRQPQRGPRTPIQEFETMSPEQRQRALNRLSPGERRKLQERLDRFNQLPEDQRRTLTNLYNRLHQLPPDRQDSVRIAINRFSEQSPDRQVAIRQELRKMAALSSEQRRQRMKSSDFREAFSKKEQDILKDMTPLLLQQ